MNDVTLVSLVIALVAGCGTRMTPTVEHVSGRAVELVEAGAGEATVVFEAGLGSDWSVWDAVAHRVSAHARVFAYSRPGYGHSDPTTDPRDAAHVVADLRALLAARGYAPPYVLVGYSFGGTYMELFAKAYPGEVQALVLVDPRHRDFGTECEREGISGCVVPEAVLSSLPPVQVAEIRAFAQASAEIAATPGFGAHPVVVLTATSHGGFSPAAEALWVSMLADLAAEAENGRQHVFDGAGHDLANERADEVAEAIIAVLR